MARLLAVSLTFVALALAALAGADPALARSAWDWPVRGQVLTAFRDAGGPYAAGQHRGVDIAAREGAPVHAATSGLVRFAGSLGSAGIVVSIRTAGGAYDTSYLHLARATVRRGEQVTLGQRLGDVGVTGRRSTQAPHLHFGVRVAGTRDYRDPLAFLPILAPPAPAARRPGPVPVLVPRRPAPERARAPRPAPARVPHALPSPSRLPVPVGAARRGAQPSPSPGLAPAPAAEPLPLGHGTPARAALPGAGPQATGSGAPAPSPAPPSPAKPAAAPSSATPSGGGPDVGWALACLGLLAAAACLGLPRDENGRRRGASALRIGLGRALGRPGRG